MENNSDRGHGWFVLVYKLPSEPTRYRASVWRKLKGAGAVYLQNGVAALPADPGAERVMRGVTREILDSEGTACLLRGEAIIEESALIKAFHEARDAEYSEVLERCQEFHAELNKEREASKFTFAELEENEDDLAKLENWFARIRTRDRFGAPLLQEAEQALNSCREDLEAYAASVYEAANHGSANS